MLAISGKLSQKIVGILIVFFLIATGAIGMTLYISWALEGVAAAINDAGSLRMRSYRIGNLIAHDPSAGSSIPELSKEVANFDRILADLKKGDPVRPLSPPRSAEVLAQLMVVDHGWVSEVRPILVAYQSGGVANRQDQSAKFDLQLEDYVAQINQLVGAMERSYTSDTNLLRTFQAVLVVLAILGTAILIRFFVGLVINPVNVLHAGMTRMTSNDLSVRLPVQSDDELGGLAHGFNQMAEHLQRVYSTLEDRVEAETKSLAQRNHELGILYEVTAFLSEPLSQAALCEGFLERIKSALGADGGAVRLYMEDTQKLALVTHDGLSEAFIAREKELNCGECLCGEVIQSGAPAVFDTANPPKGMKLGSCIREGFTTATAFNIIHGKRRLGVYNLYFLKSHPVSAQEKSLLQTIGQHLGVAIENQRLNSREKELAVFEERNLLAQELHDSIAQGLAFLNIQVQLLQDSLRKNRTDEAMQTAGQLREGVQESYDHVRELLVHFRTRQRQTDIDTGIGTALQKFEQQTGIATELSIIGGGVTLQPDENVQIMHIVQEALSNIRKHAQATLVSISVYRQFGELEVEVRDNGVGFDPVSEPKVMSDWHVGLKIMRERTDRIGGECRITSKAGEGTRVKIRLPNNRKEAVKHE